MFCHILYQLKFPTNTCQAGKKIRLIAIQCVVTATDNIIKLQENSQIEFCKLVLRTQIHINQSR